MKKVLKEESNEKKRKTKKLARGALPGSNPDCAASYENLQFSNLLSTPVDHLANRSQSCCLSCSVGSSCRGIVYKAITRRASRTRKERALPGNYERFGMCPMYVHFWLRRRRSIPVETGLRGLKPRERTLQKYDGKRERS